MYSSCGTTHVHKWLDGTIVPSSASSREKKHHHHFPVIIFDITVIAISLTVPTSSVMVLMFDNHYRILICSSARVSICFRALSGTISRMVANGVTFIRYNGLRVLYTV